MKIPEFKIEFLKLKDNYFAIVLIAIDRVFVYYDTGHISKGYWQGSGIMGAGGYEGKVYIIPDYGETSYLDSSRLLPYFIDKLQSHPENFFEYPKKGWKTLARNDFDKR